MQENDDLLDLLNLWDDPTDSTSSAPAAPAAPQVSAQGEVFAGAHANVGRLETPDPERDFVDEMSDMVVPKSKPKKSASGRPMVVVIDDDFSTLDLMKIYLQRTYEYQAFDNAREAIFYLNKNFPDLIFLDCYMSIIKAKKMVDIIRSYPDYKEVPIYLLAEADEKGAMEAKLSKGEFADVKGILTRPVSRGELQNILDEVFQTK